MYSLKDIVIYMSDKYWNEKGDPRVNNWALYNGGIWRILLIIAIYLLLTLVILPTYMKKRPPFQLKKTILAYNCFMVMINFYLFCIILANIDYGRIFFDFKYPSRDDTGSHTMWLLNLGWFIFLTRLIDLLDTVFFAMRKKQSQITPLHIYHHSVVPILGWIIAKINAMIPAMRLFLLMNTFIHSLMYGYYALSSMGPSIQRYLWWKKYITILQLGQFVVLGIYAIFGIFLQEGNPYEWQVPFLSQPFLFFFMFYKFYRQSYQGTVVKPQI